jgi:PIN domain nuclease of toxin-antitoxin system
MLLLDSQAPLWLLDDNPRLGARARQAIRDFPELVRHDPFDRPGS